MPGDPPVKTQNQLVGLLVLRSVKLIQSPSHSVVELALSAATGTRHGSKHNTMLSETAGHVPAGSSVVSVSVTQPAAVSDTDGV